MKRPLQLLCPGCSTWRDADGITPAWICPCGQLLPENVEMRGGRLDELARALELEPAGVG